MSDYRNNAPDREFKQAGVGMNATRLCMGCNLSRPIVCSAGVGVKWRCMHCLAAAHSRAASQTNVKEEA